MEIFIDDFCEYGLAADHLIHLKKTFQKCRETRLCLHPEKCFIGMKEGILLGHVIFQRGIEVDKEKVRMIVELQPPADLKQLRAFLGHVGYYDHFIYRHVDVALPLTKLLKQDEPYVWNDERQQAFHTLKDRLVVSPILSPLDWNKKFHIFIDSSAFCIGANLSQKDDNNKDHMW